jgi:hypothetical protein
LQASTSREVRPPFARLDYPSVPAALAASVLAATTPAIAIAVVVVALATLRTITVVIATLAGLGFWRLLRRRGRRHGALLLLTAE